MSGFVAGMKTSSWARVAIGSALAAVLVMHAGCASVEQGTSKTVAFVRGDLNATLDDSYDASVKATRAALERLKFTLESERGDALQSVFLARTGLDKKVDILVTKQGAKETAIRIRVGAFGDEAVAQSLLTEIKDRL